jgi:hypothetical protein
MHSLRIPFSVFIALAIVASSAPLSQDNAINARAIKGDHIPRPGASADFDNIDCPISNLPQTVPCVSRRSPEIGISGIPGISVGASQTNGYPNPATGVFSKLGSNKPALSDGIGLEDGTRNLELDHAEGLSRAVGQTGPDRTGRKLGSELDTVGGSMKAAGGKVESAGEKTKSDGRRLTDANRMANQVQNGNGEVDKHEHIHNHEHDRRDKHWNEHEHIHDHHPGRRDERGHVHLHEHEHQH